MPRFVTYDCSWHVNAVLVRWRDPTNGYAERETKVTDERMIDELRREFCDTLEVFGINDEAEAIERGRWHLAQLYACDFSCSEVV